MKQQLVQARFHKVDIAMTSRHLICSVNTEGVFILSIHVFYSINNYQHMHSFVKIPLKKIEFCFFFSKYMMTQKSDSLSLTY